VRGSDQPGVSASVRDEERLLRRVAKGDLAAFDELYRGTAPAIAVRLRRRCSDDGLVAEVLQDTYLTVWRAAGSFADLRPRGGGAAGWLWTIAARRLVDALRRQARRLDAPAKALPLVSAPAAEDEVLAGTVGGELGAPWPSSPRSCGRYCGPWSSTGSPFARRRFCWGCPRAR
jgi:RNA polymerase sigma-70 factor (ECF subfamily)